MTFLLLACACPGLLHTAGLSVGTPAEGQWLEVLSAGFVGQARLCSQLPGAQLPWPERLGIKKNLGR